MFKQGISSKIASEIYVPALSFFYRFSSTTRLMLSKPVHELHDASHSAQGEAVRCTSKGNEHTFFKSQLSHQAHKSQHFPFWPVMEL